jgi:hypothetical protein
MDAEIATACADDLKENEEEEGTARRAMATATASVIVCLLCLYAA